MSDAYLELLEWLREAPRTYDWGCLLAWDRKWVNTLLLREYMERFASDSYLPPFTAQIDTSPLTRELIYDYTLDCPRLSFDQSTYSDPRARLRMKVVGGSQLSVEAADDGSPKLARIAEIDVLAGPSLYMKLALRSTPGATNPLGQVVLDLAEGGDFELSFADTTRERLIGGEFFQERFEELPKEKKIFVLGELLVPPNEFLRPEYFEIRIHGKPGDPDAGAVLFMVRMRGYDNGGEPPTDRDLRYLLEGGYSFAMLLGQQFLLQQMFIPACAVLTDTATPFVARVESPPQGAAFYLHAVSGIAKGAYISRHSTSFAHATCTIRVPLASAQCQFKLSFSNSDIVLHWQGEYNPDVSLELHSGTRLVAVGKVDFVIKRQYRLSLIRSEGQLQVVEVSGGGQNTCEFAIDGPDVPLVIVDMFKAQLGVQMRDAVLDHLKTWLDQAKSKFVSIDLDKMTRLLFRGSEHLRFDKTGFTRDLALFGNIAPFSQVFFVQPAELLMGPGETRLFYTLPPRSVTWTVEAPAGENGPVGSINALGLYTAPHELDRPFLRVRISASAAGYTSSALVTVLPGEISVNPLVMVHSAGSSMGREMVAGARDPGSLTWTLVNPDSGARIVLSQMADGDKTYFPGPVQEGVTWSIDEIKVTHDLTRRSRTVYVMLTHFTPTLQITATPAADGKTIALKAFHEGEEIPGEYRLEWQVLLGAGTVDATSGVFTPGATSPLRFSIVIARVHWTENIKSNGYMLLPIPFIELPKPSWQGFSISPPAQR
ncbi:hypothetical protein N7650_22075 [Pseudomonas sp. GD04058]|nr:hypothetical protein [Pseudomonas sp. GD04058]MDG9885533.1 hypothetical protein [Pseudomonas sp. GD04058]